jgi:hypothetical protein
MDFGWSDEKAHATGLLVPDKLTAAHRDGFLTEQDQRFHCKLEVDNHQF